MGNTAPLIDAKFNSEPNGLVSAGQSHFKKVLGKISTLRASFILTIDDPTSAIARAIDLRERSIGLYELLLEKYRLSTSTSQITFQLSNRTRTLYSLLVNRVTREWDLDTH